MKQKHIVLQRLGDKGGTCPPSPWVHPGLLIEVIRFVMRKIAGKYLSIIHKKEHLMLVLSNVGTRANAGVSPELIPKSAMTVNFFPDSLR